MAMQTKGDGGRAEARREIEQMMGRVPEWLDQMPDGAMSAFWSMMRDFQLAETAIPNKYKELIGLAVAAATHCRYCALFHTEAARMFGASDQEIAEASMMAAHTMSASTFVNGQQIDFAKFEQETRAMIDHARKQLQAQGKVPAGQPGKHARA